MGKPIVAIVGRPNVGKSTLFNKLAGKRIAIVDDMPGVTRDRIYAQAEWLNNKFTIIDTGGIEPESEDVIVAQMRRQAQMAIEMADVVLFIVDGKQGLADADREVAQMLRKANKSIVLAVNKIDRRQLDDNIYEFYNLGLGDPMAISASQGLGLGDLLDEVVDKFPETNEDDEENEYIRIAMVGRPNVGKSSLINRILGEEKHIVSNIPGTTRDSVDSYIEREEGKFALIDTAGLRRKSKIKEQVERYSAVRTIASIENADVCILMLDAEQGIAEQDEKIIGYAHELNKAIIVIVNKWDLIEKDDKTMKNFKDKLRYELSFLPYASFLFISAKTGQRVNKVLGMAKECYNNYCKRVKTGILNEVISKAILMKEPPVVGTSRLKVYYVT
ncbi:GTP-binding protein Der, partial [Clostridium botulinum C str. Stockholm]